VTEPQPPSTPRRASPPPAWAPPPGWAVVAPPPPPRPRALPDAPPAGVRWGVPDAAIVIAIFPVTIGLSLLYLVLRLPASSGLFSFVGALASYLLIAAAVIVVSHRRGLGRLSRDFGLSFRPIDLAIGLGIAALAKVVQIVVAIFVVAATGHAPTRSNVSFGHDPMWIIINGFLIGSLLAPVVEELVFRGLLLRAIRNAFLRGRRKAPHPQPADVAVRSRATALAIVLSAAVFSAGHLYETVGDLSLFLSLAFSLFAVGVLHAWVTVVTGRLGAAIVSHVLFNAFGVAIALALTR
jgi:membrane protease YdiL (CAAX protease family)